MQEKSKFAFLFSFRIRDDKMFGSGSGIQDEKMVGSGIKHPGSATIRWGHSAITKVFKMLDVLTLGPVHA
jgi:hypothetical protein